MKADLENYLKTKGQACPFCQSTDIESQSDISVGDSGIAWHNIQCNSCDQEWRDEYRLVGIAYEETIRSTDEQEAQDADDQ